MLENKQIFAITPTLAFFLTHKPKMANPSTQVPSNAITTEIIFAQEFSQVSYTLLEIPKSLESFMKENEDNGLRYPNKLEGTRDTLELISY